MGSNPGMQMAMPAMPMPPMAQMPTSAIGWGHSHPHWAGSLVGDGCSEYCSEYAESEQEARQCIPR